VDSLKEDTRVAKAQIPLGYNDRTVCILGLGFVGLTLAAIMAEAGFQVVGVEIRKDVLEKLRAGLAHFYEPGLTDAIRRAVKDGRLKVRDTIPSDCGVTVYIITVGTPVGAEGRVNLDSVTRIAREIAERMNHGDIVVLRSTVKIGTTERLIRPILAKSGKQFQIAFCPERTIEGQALAELRYLPQIIGAADHATVTRAAQLFNFVTPTVIRVSNAETAELIKLIDNGRRDLMFAYANEVARICDTIGLSAAEVIRSGRFGYTRTDLPMPGPVGGPCLSKDAYILAESLEQFGILPEITISARRVNERQLFEIIDYLEIQMAKFHFAAAPRIALLGIAFKGRPATDDVRGTMAIPIRNALSKAFPNASIVAHDPVVDAETLRLLGFLPIERLEDAFAEANVVFILNNHPDYAAMPIETLTISMARPSIVYDCWSNFVDQPIQLPASVQYIALGSHCNPIVGSDRQ
jgi:UDP-N-acetyl-D-mannosaminuronic acid dehydrogenase